MNQPAFPFKNSFASKSPKPQLPHQLTQVANQCPQPETPFLLTVDKVIAAIQQGQAAQISLLEWIYCLQNKAVWDRQYPEQATSSAQAIWRTATQKQDLRDRLFWRLALYWSGQKEAIAPSLAETFSQFKTTLQTNDSLTVQILDKLSANNPSRAIVAFACQLKLTCHELIRRVEHTLPTSMPAFQTMTEEVAPYLAMLSPLNADHITWLMACLNEMSESSEIRAVDYLLTRLPVKVGSSFPQLVSWLQKNYSWQNGRDRWLKLSEAARTALRSWIGSVNYGDFEKLIDQIINRLKLEDFEINQLQRRKAFWANYSDRFEQRIRVLLPQQSAKVLAHQNWQENDILVSDGSDPTEICIFDFGDWFVAEFFRGSGSETRLFRKSDFPTLENLFLGSSPLSVKKIRCQGGVKHDHVYLWQFACVQWLQAQGIYPNDGIEHFQGLSREHGRYSRTTGLPVPSQDKLKEREKRLQKWRAEISKLEEEARIWCMRQHL